MAEILVVEATAHALARLLLWPLFTASACHLVDQKLGLTAKPLTSLVNLHLGWVLSLSFFRCCPCLPEGGMQSSASPLRICCVHLPHLLHHSRGVLHTLLLELHCGWTVMRLWPLLIVLSMLLAKLPGSQGSSGLLGNLGLLIRHKQQNQQLSLQVQ